jgi:hypothetical protein
VTYFQRVQWLHGDPEEPVVLWAHVVDGWEVRKVDEFADGRLAWADGGHEDGATRLSSTPMPTPEEIAGDAQFVVEVVDESSFERMWARAHAGS